MRRTLKYQAALDCAANVLDRSELNRAKRDNATLYDTLERRGWFYDQPNGKWQDFKPSTSMFTTDAGLPTGAFRLRAMCNPGDLKRLVELITESLDTYGASITETSGAYPNRRGPGVRVYMSGQLPDPKGGRNKPCTFAGKRDTLQMFGTDLARRACGDNGHAKRLKNAAII